MMETISSPPGRGQIFFCDEIKARGFVPKTALRLIKLRYFFPAEKALKVCNV